MAETRKGLNCTLTYPQADGKNNSFRLRVGTVGYGIAMIASESTGRNRRAYYPHREAPTRFYIQPILVGFGERKTFSDWMQTYADYVMNPGLPAGANFPDIRVLIPARNFDRQGVPISGWEGGDTIGGMVWTPTVVFETTKEPQDPESVTPSSFVNSTDPDLKYFWPMGTQLGGNAVPSGNYATIVGNDNGSTPVGNGNGVLPSTGSGNEVTPPYSRSDYGQ